MRASLFTKNPTTIATTADTRLAYEASHFKSNLRGPPLLCCPGDMMHAMCPWAPPTRMIWKHFHRSHFRRRSRSVASCNHVSNMPACSCFLSCSSPRPHGAASFTLPLLNDDILTRQRTKSCVGSANTDAEKVFLSGEKGTECLPTVKVACVLHLLVESRRVSTRAKTCTRIK